MPADDHADLHTRLSEQDKTLSSIDTNLTLLRKELLGNGQPGRLTKVETKVEDLEAHKNRAIGYSAAIGGVITIVFALFEYFKHAKP